MNEILNALQQRRSVRSFQKRQLEEATLLEILDAGLWAPSAMNGQPVMLVAVQDAPTIAQLSRLNAQVMGAEADPFYGAPTVIVVLADFDRATCVEDGTLALGNLMLAAHALDVGACWIHRARQVFEMPEGKLLLQKWGVPEEYIGIGHCILGYREGAASAAKTRKGGRVVRI